MVESLFALLILIAFFGGVMWVIRLFARASGKPADVPAPTLSDVLAIEPDALPPPEASSFKQPHGLQVAVYFAASGLMLLALLWSLVAHGWSLLGIILVAAEVLLLFLHGAPLAVNIARSVRVSPEGIETKGLLKQRSIPWWEIQFFQVNDDLSGFRVEGLRQAFFFDTSGFGPAAKLAMYSAIRTQLIAHQVPMTARTMGAPVVRFLKSNAASTAIFLAVAFAAALTADQFLPEGNVLGLRCSYASEFLREKYDLPNRQGCVTLRVNQGTGAYQAGLREGDMIVAVEGAPITSGPQFTIYWESLDKQTQEFTIVRPGETNEVTLKVTLGGHGRLPEYDPADPYFFYLRARGAEDSSQAIRDFTKAIELAPEFDLAYVYRGALYTEANVPDLARADLDKAIELDPELTEAYRERAWYYIFTGDYQSASVDGLRAVELDGCNDGFQTYNYDCHVDYLLLSYAYGERGDPNSLREAVEDAKLASEFYPERPRSYYLAAYYLAGLEQMEEAKDYAARYLEIAEGFEEPGNLVDWAQRLVSGSGFPDQTDSLASDELDPSALFVAAEGDIDPDGEPTVTLVAFSDKRTSDTPNGARYLTPDRQQLWAYFEFDNAANVRTIYWEWTQNSYVHTMADGEDWPGTNKGSAWLRLENRFPNEASENTLMIRFDDKVVIDTTFHLRTDPYVGPLTFYTDAQLTQPLLFYSGQPNQIYASLYYVGALPKTGLFWAAEKDGAQVAGDVIEVVDSGTLTIPINLPAGLNPGLVDVRVYLDGLPVRTAGLAIASQETVASPPFSGFQIGLEPDSEGNFAKITKEFSRNLPEFRYWLTGIDVPPGSSLTLRWLRNGTPIGFAPDTISSSDGTRALNGAVQGNDGYLEPGEYRVVIGLDAQAIYADVVVVR